MLALSLEGFRPRHPFPFPDLPFASSRIPSSAGLCKLRVSPSSSRSLFGLSLFFKKGQNITPLFSDSSALFKKECFDNPLPFNSFRTLLQNTRGGTPQVKISSRLFSILSAPCPSLAAKSRRILTYEKWLRNPFTIRTSKTQDLKSFRIRTYEKTGEGGPARPLSSAPKTDPQHPSVTLVGVPFWERPCGKGDATRVKTLGR
jgi:hypothetical protein